MNFTDAGNVREAVDSMRTQEETLRSENRARINDLFNGMPPWTEEEATEDNAETNVNFLEAATIAHRARSTWNNAFLKPGSFFTVTLNAGPTWRRDGWGHIITAAIKRVMKASRRYVEVIRATGAQVVLHGIGPVWWPKNGFWLPEEIGIEDLLMPSATRVNLENLPHFAIYQQFTAGQLYRMTHREHVDEGWNMKLVNGELKRIASEFAQTNQSDVELSNPEKLAEFYKANGGVFDSDRVPTINVWTFFHQDDEDKEGRWFKKIILESTVDKDQFLYNAKRPFAEELSQILHIQFGDGANVAPFRYHSVRSLGFLLFAVCHQQNRTRCAFADAVKESLLQYFYLSSGDRAMAEKIDLHHLGVIPEGVRMVPPGDRWQVNENLVGAMFSQNRQLMAENASAFVQDMDNTTGKELTATEVMARLNSANALVSSLLSQAYTYQSFQYAEICRRFCDAKSMDPDVQQFRKEVISAGVPEQALDVQYWDIEPERVMGGGNKTLEIAQAKSLMEIKQQLDPPAQRIVLRHYVLAITDNADFAFRLVPDDEKRDNPARQKAEWALGTLMHGMNVETPQSIDRITYIETLIKGLIEVVQQTAALEQQAGEIPTGKSIAGMVAVHSEIVENLQVLAQDDAEKERVRQYGDVVSEAMNKVKQFAQHLEEHQKAIAKDQGEMAKTQLLAMQAQVKNQIAVSQAKLKAVLEQAKFNADEQRKNLELSASLQREGVATVADIQSLTTTTRANVEALDARTTAEIEALDRKTTAGIDALKRTTEAKVEAARKSAQNKPDKDE